MNFKPILLSVLSVFILLNVNQAFATTEEFTVPPGKQTTFDVFVDSGDTINYTVSISGGENNDIVFRIIDSYGVYHEIPGFPIGDDPKIISYFQNSVSNTDDTRGKLSFTFDNSFSTFSSKQVIFSYTIDNHSLEEQGYEQNALWSNIFGIGTLVIILIIIIIGIVFVIKKIKRKKNK